MLQVITGRFHPQLESALLECIRQTKASDPFAPLAVLVPSKPLLDHLKRLLAVEHRLSLFNVHLLTFHQFALRLADEICGSGKAAPCRVVDDLFFEQLIRHLVHSRLSGLALLGATGHSSGTWRALWSTVRDLQDAGVDPAAALHGLREGCFEQEDHDWLQALFTLHAGVKEAGAALGVGTADDLAWATVPVVPTSSFLASLNHVLYYGFYDLTQVQLSLFEAVSTTVPTTLFFPLGKDGSFAFARRFFDRYIQPRIQSCDALTESGTSDSNSVTLSQHSVIGVEAELSSVCRTILDLVETNGFRFDEIGVVARTLDPYRMALQPVLDRHCIPFATTAGRALILEPLCKALLQLAALPTNDFYSVAVLDVVTSPFYNWSSNHQPNGFVASYRPEQWKLIVEALQITHGIDEWSRLARSSQSALELDDDSEESGKIGSVYIRPEVIAHLWQTVSQLLQTCSALPARGTIRPLLTAFQRLVSAHFRRPEEAEARAGDPGVTRLLPVWEAIERTLDSLLELDGIGEELSWAEFVELLTQGFERGSVMLQTVSPNGVTVADAMTARGMAFKALFVLGLNEKVFPRYIREDPFLRDRHRRVLETTLGFKIDEKLNGYDEEALLFTLLSQAVSSRLYLSFQRADDAGRMLACSPYLTTITSSMGMDPHPVEAIPRRITTWMAQRPSMRKFLPPPDLAQWMALDGQDPGDLLEATGRDVLLFQNAMRALEHIEHDQPALTVFDGMTGPLDGHWSRLIERGVAPTPLERYARCPFRYFSADVLKLEPVRLPISKELDARTLGALCHRALRRCYEMLVPSGWPAEPVTDDTIKRYITSAVEEAAIEYETLHRTGHYLLWELAKARIVDMVRAAVDADTRALAEQPYIPVAFEVEAEGALTGVLPDSASPLVIRGRLDRIDRHRESGTLRIVDYKLKFGSTMQSDDRNLLQAAVRGARLQPPLYAHLNLPVQGTLQEVQFLFLAPQWPSPVTRATFNTAAWSSETGTLLRRTLSLLMEGIRSGQFFIVPDSYCETCEYRVACRREHAPSSWRAYRAPEPKALTTLRAIRVSNE